MVLSSDKNFEKIYALQSLQTFLSLIRMSLNYILIMSSMSSIQVHVNTIGVTIAITTKYNSVVCSFLVVIAAVIDMNNNN